MKAKNKPKNKGANPQPSESADAQASESVSAPQGESAKAAAPPKAAAAAPPSGGDQAKSKYANIKFSLIIPTRNRQRYAIAAIESAINCQAHNLQIVVSDNSDSDQLREMILARGWMSRVTYVKSKKTLSMRGNWEFGLDACEGDYVTIIGDDDAVLPDCFEWAKRALEKTEAEVLSGSYSIFKWDDYPFPGRQNYLQMTMGDSITVQKDPKQWLRAGLAYKTKLGTGPGLYYGFVSMDFLKRNKANRGRWVVDTIPDFDSGFAALMYAESIAKGERNVFVSGHGAKSNSGRMRLAGPQRDSIIEVSSEDGVEEDYLLVDEEPSLRCNQAIIVSCQFRMLPEIRKALGDESIEIDRIGAWNYLASGISSGYERLSFEEKIAALKRLAEAWGISDKVEVPANFSTSAGIMHEQGPHFIPSKNENERSRALDRLVINGNRLGWKTILDAVAYVHAAQPLLRDVSGQLVVTGLPENARISRDLQTIKALAGNGEVQEAFEHTQALIRDHPLHPGAMAAYTDLLVAQGSIELARIEASRLLSFHAESTPELQERYGYLVE